MFPLISLAESFRSTNEAILDYYSPQQPTFGLCTFHQINGKGQYGNQWHMPKDKNIAYSFLIKESEIFVPKNILNFHTAMVIRNFLAKMTNQNVLVKWPNDLIINRKKVCGMLIETTKIKNENHYIIGIGINVLQEDFGHLPKAGSLLTQTHQKFDLEIFAKEFHHYFSENICKNLYGDILEHYNTFLFGKDSVSLFSKNGMRQNGIIQHTDDEGYLWIHLENDGLEKFFHKEIEMLY